MVIPSTTTNNNNETLVYNHKLTSLVPDSISRNNTIYEPNNNTIYEPNNLDLAFKLHYIKLVYFLDNKAVEGLTLKTIKERAFKWLNYYYETCGRFRRSENGRPYIKCNDGGVRLIEANASMTLQEWLAMDDVCSHNSELLPQCHVLGPELTFSPTVFLQITFFKCGGFALGVSWAHVLGDTYSLSNYMSSLAQFLNGHEPNHPPPPQKQSPPNFQKPIKAVSPTPLSISNVGPVGDLWIKPTQCEMDTFSFHVSEAQLAQLQIKVFGSVQPTGPAQPFEAICAIVWQAIAKTRDGPKPNVITVLRNGDTGPIKDELLLMNDQVVSSVKADFVVEEAKLKDLATLIRDWAQDERAQIGELVDRDPRASDCIIYGSKLTFVDLEQVGFDGFELKGMSPRFVHCLVDGVGEEGVVLVQPAPKDGYDGVNTAKGGNGGRIVTLTLPKSYMEEIKEVLKNEGELIA